jgi:hypothetical protein
MSPDEIRTAIASNCIETTGQEMGTALSMEVAESRCACVVEVATTELKPDLQLYIALSVSGRDASDAESRLSDDDFALIDRLRQDIESGQICPGTGEDSPEFRAGPLANSTRDDQLSAILERLTKPPLAEAQGDEGGGDEGESLVDVGAAVVADGEALDSGRRLATAAPTPATSAAG